jgi:hypothetical protein
VPQCENAYDNIKIHKDGASAHTLCMIYTRYSCQPEQNSGEGLTTASTKPFPLHLITRLKTYLAASGNRGSYCQGYNVYTFLVGINPCRLGCFKHALSPQASNPWRGTSDAGGAPPAGTGWGWACPSTDSDPPRPVGCTEARGCPAGLPCQCPGRLRVG